MASVELWVQVLVLAVLQGISELFPISSLGHTVLVPGLLDWGNLTQDENFLPIVVTLHLGTAAALLLFYWRDWLALLRGGLAVLRARDLAADADGKTLFLVIIGTIPAGLLGLALEHPIERIFFSARFPVLTAAFLCLNGAILLLGEQARQRIEPAGVDRAKQEGVFHQITDLTVLQALWIGLAQAAALVPGISRSGVTMVAGMGAKLSHEEALRYTFLLATPLIAAAGLLEVPKLFHAGSGALIVALAGGVVAGFAALVSVAFLTRYFRVGRLTPFAYYCLAAGFVTFALFAALSMGWERLPW